MASKNFERANIEKRRKIIDKIYALKDPSDAHKDTIARAVEDFDLTEKQALGFLGVYL